MLSRAVLHLAGVSAAALALCACGGGGGEHVAFTPTPVPSPTPTPTPACPPTCSPPAIFPRVTSSSDLAALGYEKDSSGNLSDDRLAVRYDAATGLYVFTLPSTQPGSFKVNNESSFQWIGSLVDASGGIQEEHFYVRKPTDPQLAYTAIAQGAGSFMAFGVPTAAGAVPLTGTATYNATLAGDAQGYSVAGTASLSFDFGGGKLSGYLDPVLYDGWGTPFSSGRFDFVNTVYSTRSTTFSGQLSNPAYNSFGSFDGRFTGPAAEELMAKWQAPFIDPYTLEQGKMFGVLVGKK
jgi:hypothetical protein